MATMTEEKKAQVKETKTLHRLENLLKPRFGLGAASTNVEENEIKFDKIPLSEIVFLDPEELTPNPNNPYVQATPKQLELLVSDIKKHGVVVPLIVTEEKKIICGHNRRTGAIKAGLDRVPVQYVQMKVTTETERMIMRLENDLRRGGKWTAADKEEFVKANFFDEALRDDRGGARNKGVSKADGTGTPFAEKVNMASKGEISVEEARHIKKKLRKEAAPKVKKEVKEQTGVKALKADEGSLKILITFHDIRTYRKAEKAIGKMSKTIFRG